MDEIAVDQSAPHSFLLAPNLRNYHNPRFSVELAPLSPSLTLLLPGKRNAD